MSDRNSEQQKFHFFYQHLSGDIENTKRRQWLIRYYILLLFVAIIGFLSLDGLTDQAISIMKIPVSVTALVVAIAGLWHIIDVHLTQVKYRRKIYQLEHHNLPHTYHFLRSEERSLLSDFYLISFTLFFSLVVLVGLFFVLIFIGIPWYCRAVSLVVAAGIGYGTYYFRKKNLEKDLPISSLKPTEKVCPVCGSSLTKPENR